MTQDKSLTPQEVADILKIAKNTVYELIKRGELKAYRVGRKFRVDFIDVEEYKNNSRDNKKSIFSEISSVNIENAKVNSPIPNTGVILCGQDVALDILCRHIEYHPKGIQILRSYMGSYNALYSLYQDKVHIATTHLWDGDTDSYNIPYIKRLVPGIPTITVHLACRNIGFYVNKGNPKNIKSWLDLDKKNISIVNREKGSGARILLDEHLRLHNIDPEKINGYAKECTSHLAVASAISRGDADLGIGTEKTSLQVQGIEFIPMKKERYEIVIKKQNSKLPYFNTLMEILNSDEFKLELKGLGGYDITETGNVIG